MWKKIVAGLLIVIGAILVFSNQINERYIDHQVQQTAKEALAITPEQIRINNEIILPERLEEERFDFAQVEALNFDETWQTLWEKVVESEPDQPFEYTNSPDSSSATGQPVKGNNTDPQTYTNANPNTNPNTNSGGQSKPAPTNQPVPMTTKNPSSMTDEEAKRAIEKYAQKQIIGIIKIPAIKLEVGILKGVLNRTLMLGAGTLRPEQVMGEDNYSLAGHRTRRPGLLFSGVPNLNTGQLMHITDKKTIYSYRVYERFNVQASQSQVIYDQVSEKRGKPVLTLVTCFALSDPNIRVIVQGELIETQPFTPEAFSKLK